MQWNIGLNPYNYLQECYGGVPTQGGIIKETDEYVKMVLPDAYSLTHIDEAYLQVRQYIHGAHIRENKLFVDISLQLTPCF